MSTEMKIGALARVTQTSVPTVRYYEQIGLLPPAARQGGSQRVYSEADVRRLTFIRRCREFGFPIEQVRLLASLVQDPNRACSEARDLAQAHLMEVKKKREELEELERSIAAFVKTCDESCSRGSVADCVVLQDLSNRRPTAAKKAGRCCIPKSTVVRMRRA
jgi:DNA-binding transcriptional MerR regulator